MKKILGLFVAITTLSLATGALAAPFTSGNLVIYRVGGLADGSDGAALTNNGNIVWLDEYTTSGTHVQSIMMPTNFFGANSPLIADALATTEGEITRSVDGRFIALTGYGATLGQITNFALPSENANVVPRVVGLVDGNGHIDTTTVQTNTLSDGESFRSAATTDGTNLWFSGDTSGLRYTTRGASTATQLSSFVTNLRQINIFSNQLYFSDASGSAIRLGFLTNAMPVTTGGSFMTNLVGVTTSNGSAYSFLLLKLTGGADPFDTLYYADDSAGGSDGTGVIFKYSLVGGIWSSNGFINAPAARGLTGFAEVSGGTTNVHLFSTTGGSTGNNIGGGSLYTYVDSTSYNHDPGSPDVNDILDVSSAGDANGTVFRGIAFAPVGGETFPIGPAQLSVGPITDVFFSRGFTGGPFTYTKNYSVANLGASPMTWSVSSPANWVGFSTTNGTLSSGSSITVAVSFNANANSLLTGTNLSTITFTNSTAGNNGLDVTTRPVTLILSQLGVSPSSNYFASGPLNGPFTPSSQTYTLTNGSTGSMTWGASILSSNWLTLSATSGTLASGGKTNITVSITNANAVALSRGSFVDTVAFTNATASDPGNATRSVTLLIGGGFSSNNIVIYRAGDGVLTINNQPTPVYLDEYTRSGLLVESIPVSTNNYACAGNATAEGLMTRSTDKQYLVFVGYGTNRTYGAPAPSSLSTVVPRVIGRVDGNGNVDVTTRLTDFNSGGNPRAAVSTNGVDMWVAGSVSGIRHTTLGSTSSSDVCTNPTSNMRALNIYSNQLYASSASSTMRIAAIGVGLPTSDTTAVDLPGTPSAGGSPYNFVLFKLKVGGTDPFDTLYIADDGGNNAGTVGGGTGGASGAIYKWSLVSGTWTSNGFGTVVAVRGLAGDVSIVGTTTNVNLFAVGSGNGTAGGGTLTAYTDSTGWNAAPSGNGGNIGTAIASAPVNEAWRSIALAPEIPVTASLSATPGDFIVTDGPSSVTTNSKSYLVSDVSSSSMTWTATWSSSWLSLSTFGGTLAAGANTNVVASINGNATSLANGTYLDTITFSNKVNNQGTTVRNVSLTITGSVVVADGFTTWQNQYFGTTGGSAAGGADPFGKGMSNTNQFLAGFDPTNKSAYVHITAISKVNAGADVRVDYLGASGNSIAPPNYTSRTNVLEFTAGTGGSYNSNNFVSTGQTNILSGGTGAGTLTNMVDPGGATNKPSRYYRVRVLVP